MITFYGLEDSYSSLLVSLLAKVEVSILLVLLIKLVLAKNLRSVIKGVRVIISYIHYLMLDDILSERTSEWFKHLLGRRSTWLVLHSLLNHGSYVLSLWFLGAVTIDIVEFFYLIFLAALSSRCILLFYHVQLVWVVVPAVINDVVVIGPVHSIIKHMINALALLLPTHWLLILFSLRVFLFVTVKNGTLFLLTMVDQGIDLLNYTAQLLLLSR